jgi:hypothetical protein
MLNHLVRYSCGIVLFLAITLQTNATPVSEPAANTLANKVLSLKLKDLQKIAGRKLTLKEKIGFGILKHQMRRHASNAGTGQVSLILGVVSIVALVAILAAVSFIWVSLAFGIAAIITGSISIKKNPNDKQAKTGRLLGWISVAIIAAILLVALAVTTTGLSW